MKCPTWVFHTKVLKLRSDRSGEPVEPSTGLRNGPINPLTQLGYKTSMNCERLGVLGLVSEDEVEGLADEGEAEGPRR